jgi:2-oxoglutarate dehydrogenase E2 component (dihydrolipoamide succinyltransferase)
VPTPEPEPVAAPSTAGPSAPVTEGPVTLTAAGLPRRGTAAPAADAEEVAAPAPIEPPAPAAPLIPPAPPAPAVDRPSPAHMAPAGDDVAAPPPPPFPEPVVAEAPAGIPEGEDTLLPGVGFGGLAVTNPGPSMWSAASNGGQPLPVRPTSDANGNGATATGLTRRVPGAQRPDAALGAREPEPAPAEPVRTTPEDVYSFLSNFQSGVARGRADAANGATEPQEEAR